MKKILFVTGSMLRGGAERVISLLSNELVERGYDISVIQLLYSGCGYELDKRVRRIDISSEKQNQLLDTPRLIFELRQEIKRNQYDVVISFMLTMNIVAYYATRGLNVRFIPSERNDPSKGRGKIKKFLQKIVYAESTKTVFQTQKARNYFNKKIQNNSVVIPNPVIIQDFHIDEKKKKIVNVGRLEKQKNQKMLISAFKKVHESHPEYNLHIYGEGSCREELQSFVNTLNCNEYVIFHGNVENVQEHIADAEIFVMTSLFEGLSNALLEAAGLGLACVSTDCAGVDEVIDNGRTGFIVKQNDIDGLTSAINQLIEQPSLASEMGKSISEKTKTMFSLEEICNQWISLIA